MSRRLLLRLAVLAPVLLAGCASDWTRSYRRWDGYIVNSGAYTQWARCIRDRSHHYLDTENSPPADVVPGNDAQLFTNVLADCRRHMTGEGWSHLRSDELRRLIADAYQDFFSVRVEINSRMEQAISN